MTTNLTVDNLIIECIIDLKEKWAYPITEFRMNVFWKTKKPIGKRQITGGNTLLPFCESEEEYINKLVERLEAPIP